MSDTAYTDFARHVASLLAKPELQGRTQLVVAATSLGQPFYDVLTEGGIDYIAVTMTAGQSWQRRGNKATVAKNALLETLAAGFEIGALDIAHDLPLRNPLVQEVASFELEATAVGNVVLARGGKGHHADMAIALGLAWFVSDSLVLNSFVGQGKLANYW